MISMHLQVFNQRLAARVSKMGLRQFALIRSWSKQEYSRKQETEENIEIKMSYTSGAPSKHLPNNGPC